MSHTPYVVDQRTRLQIIREDLKNDGIVGFALRRVQKNIIDPIQRVITTALHTNSSITIGTQSISYLDHPYNSTWSNERCIEIPFFQSLLASLPKGSKILEVGHTLTHYVPSNHQIIDKYEPGLGVQNVDILEYQDSTRFDLIFAISTIEHIGVHEEDTRANKVVFALKHMRSLLTTTGSLWVSFPAGVNPDLDRVMRNRELPWKECYFFRRDRWNRWSQSNLKEYLSAQYNTPFPHANTLCIAKMTNS